MDPGRRSSLLRPESALMIGACVVMVLTGSLAAAIALMFAATAWVAVREWPRSDHAAGQQFRAWLSLSLVAAAAIVLVVGHWIPAVGLFIVAALAAPAQWVRVVIGRQTSAGGPARR